MTVGSCCSITLVVLFVLLSLKRTVMTSSIITIIHEPPISEYINELFSFVCDVSFVSTIVISPVGIGGSVCGGIGVYAVCAGYAVCGGIAVGIDELIGHNSSASFNCVVLRLFEGERQYVSVYENDVIFAKLMPEQKSSQ